MVQKIAVPSGWPIPRYSLGQKLYVLDEFCMGQSGSVVGIHFDPGVQEWSYTLDPDPGSEQCDGIQHWEEDVAPLHRPLCL